MPKVGFLTSDLFQQHLAPPGHPECPERLASLLDYLTTRPIYPELTHIEPTPADLRWIQTIHDAQHIEQIREASNAGPMFLDHETTVSPRSYDAAVLAVGALLAACDAVVAGQVGRAFCAVRPPGHHAEADRAMGFCLFNNVAIAARYLQQHHGLERVCIVDWDVHHGNGTQHAFDDDPTVLFFSIHRHGALFYPGTGSRDEWGRGEALGTTINVPLPAGQGDDAAQRSFDDELAPAVERFRPNAILISAGFDAYERDPLGGMRVTLDGFAALTRAVCRLADATADGRVISTLEGGYDLDGLGPCVEAHLQALAE